jgi:hypothetical protein
MPCSEYDLQGLHAGIHLARETDGRLGEYQCLSPAFRTSNSFYIALILLAQGLLYFLLAGEQAGEGHGTICRQYVQLSHLTAATGYALRSISPVDTPSPVTITIITVRNARPSYVVPTVIAVLRWSQSPRKNAMMLNASCKGDRNIVL